MSSIQSHPVNEKTLFFKIEKYTEVIVIWTYLHN